MSEKRIPPPPRPRGLPAPHYRRPDGSDVYAVDSDESPSPSRVDLGPGKRPDFTPGEQLFDDFLMAVGGQLYFNYVETDDGQLRQYWCPHCDGVTAVINGWHCEQCGEWFCERQVDDQVDDQVDKPTVSIPFEIAEKLSLAFNDTLYGEKDALELKPGKKRRTLSDYYLELYAAHLVEDRIGPKTSMTRACDDVAAELADRKSTKALSGRHVQRWYRAFFPAERDK